MIFSKPLIAALGVSGVMLIGVSGFAAYYRGEAKSQRAEKELLAASNLTLTNAIDTIKGAHEAEIKAREAAANAGEETRRELERRASEAEDALNEARINDPTLDRCMRYDPGVDLTGGLWNADG